MKDVIIIGSGPAGYSAAIYAARAALKVLVIAGSEPGGQLTTTTDVENYPGFAEVIQGPWLMEQMQKQAAHVGAEIKFNFVERVDFSNQPFTCYLDNQEIYTAKTIIIATGAQAKWLGIASETKYRGFGVSGCATCDGFFYKNKKVMVVGGGNSAVEEALFLTNFASEVILVHRRDSLRAEKILQERLFAHPKIKVVWNHQISEILGDGQFVNGVRIEHTVDHTSQEIPVDGVFIAIGHSPNTSLFKGQIAMDNEGYIITENTKTNVTGIFAAGDVQDKIYRQAITAAGTGCMAALEVNKLLQEG